MKFLSLLFHSLLEYLPISSSLFFSIYKTESEPCLIFLHMISGLFTLLYFLPQIKQFVNLPFISFIFFTGISHIFILLVFLLTFQISQSIILSFLILILLNYYKKYLHNFTSSLKLFFFLYFLILSDKNIYYFLSFLSITTLFFFISYRNKSKNFNLEYYKHYLIFMLLIVLNFIFQKYQLSKFILLILNFIFSLIILINKKIFNSTQIKQNIFFITLLFINCLGDNYEIFHKSFKYLFAIPIALMLFFSAMRNKNTSNFDLNKINPLDIALLNGISLYYSGTSRLGLFLTYFFINNIKFSESLKYGFLISGIINFGLFVAISFVCFVFFINYGHGFEVSGQVYKGDFFFSSFSAFKRCFLDFSSLVLNHVEKNLLIELNGFDFIKISLIVFIFICIFLHYAQKHSKFFVLNSAFLRIILLFYCSFYYLIC